MAAPAARLPAPTPHRLTVLPGGWNLPAAHNQTLLQAARAAGIRLPSSCRNGTCRTCLARLLSGQVAYTIDWPGLLAEEKAEGWILPCVACARSDVVIDAPAASPLLGGC
ncbi:MAG: hypothetical protein A3E25_08395 [Burkholderiales bacterium RIFCSPHIGHO2_12_FULL_69_20]|nr:MAG: hypothetical protein A3E25_08395 [Burkholderiales bacterium RIFCSPHIGHO2_12_FULL_69_20]